MNTLYEWLVSKDQGMLIGPELRSARVIALIKIAPPETWADIESLLAAAREWHASGHAPPARAAPVAPPDPPAPSVPDDHETTPSGPIKVVIDDGSTVEVPDLFEL